MFRPSTLRSSQWPRLLAVLAVLVLLGAMLPGASASTEWPGFQKDAKKTGLQTGKDLPGDLSILWQAHLDGNVRSSPVVAKGIAYIATEKGNVYGLDVRNGNPLWGPVRLGEPVVGTPAFENDKLYVASSSADGASGKIYVLNGATGKWVMNITLPKGSYGGPAIHDGKLFVGHDGGSVLAYDTETMTKLWEFKTNLKVDKTYDPSDYGGEDCCLTADVKERPVKSSPLIYQNRVYFGSFNHQFFAIDARGNPGAETTSLVWAENVHGIVYSSAGVGSHANLRYDLVVVGSYDGNVYAYDTEPLNAPASCPMYGSRTHHAAGNDCSKRIQWVHETDSSFFASPAIANDRAYIGDESGLFYALDMHRGAVKWQYDTGNTIRSSAAVLNNTVVVGGFDGKLYLFKEDAAGGLLPGYPKSVALSDRIQASPAIAGDTVFVATQDGVMYALAAPGTEVEGGSGVVPLGPPDYALNDLVLTPRKAVGGQPLEVTVTISNGGGNAPGPVNVRLYNGETLLAENDVDVPGGQSQPHSFHITPQAGDLFLKIVVNENGSIEEKTAEPAVLEQHHVVEAGAPPPVEDPVDPSPVDDESKEEDAPAPAVTIFMATLALLVGLRRRRS